jgi:uncharacterized metal-binding protein YceD (DUF177 family)
MPEASPPAVASAPPFSRPFDVETQKEFPVTTDIAANEAEREALAEMFNIPGVGELTARIKIVRTPAGQFIVSGEASARVTRTCVVTLEPFEVVIREPVDGFFEAVPPKGRRPARAPEREVEVHVDTDEEPPEPLTDGCIDLGVLAAEFVALGLDPYPRKPDARFELSPDVAPAEASPFAVLERLKKVDPPK